MLKWLLIAGLVLLLILFFFPKKCSVHDDHFTATESIIENMQCTCLGFSVPDASCKSCTQISYCWGLPVSCEYSCEVLDEESWKQVPCAS
ncbi:hypothetical protein GF342_01115 [Candidatus Woesearchaeota archaeon]|nr:hypothetical protein [Candidatus Woesearchaeota archaeon]